ncbi:peptidyl-prolyl cis-trans isomerase FKBP1A isoform X1 [Bubalus kerabau]|uniref:peptidyl-prolyl cis-trans isomerase FKBP1A isoform X1 n=1 Tax=Bubalus carabanensis TaxID=3119969 RepID=UPI00244EB7E2|nr:peptidyl-prolyl cis-trans isomerase FKBP1A isoform X1 [Bubalus carabanensis]
MSRCGFSSPPASSWPIPNSYSCFSYAETGLVMPSPPVARRKEGWGKQPGLSERQHPEASGLPGFRFSPPPVPHCPAAGAPGTCAPCGARTQGGACGGARVRSRSAEGPGRAEESPRDPVSVHAACRTASRPTQRPPLPQPWECRWRPSLPETGAPSRSVARPAWCTTRIWPVGAPSGGLPGWVSSKESACSAEDTGDAGSIPGSGRSPGGVHGNPLQYLCHKNPMNGGL